MKRTLFILLVASAPFVLTACSSGGADEGGQAVTTKPEGFKAAEGSAAGGGAPAGQAAPTGQAGAGDRPGGTAPPGP